MIASHQGIDKTSKKIKAVAKILPFLINKDDQTAIQVVANFLADNINYHMIDE